MSATVPIAELTAPGDLIRCDRLRAPLAARHCVALAAREVRRPLGCLGCPQGALVRARLGAPEPTSIAVAAPQAPVEVARHAPGAPCSRGCGRPQGQLRPGQLEELPPELRACCSKCRVRRLQARIERGGTDAPTTAAIVAARHRSRETTTPAEADEARGIVEAIYGAYASRGVAEAAMGLGRGTLIGIGTGRLTRGTLDVLRAAHARVRGAA